MARKGGRVMPRSLLNRMRDAVRAADVEGLTTYAYEIERRQLGSDTFNPHNLEMILTLLADPTVLASPSAGPILAPLEFDADKLTSGQQRVVVEALERAYPRLADRMAQFQITEFVGRKFASKNALWLFSKLITVADEGARALVAHGFEHVVCAGSRAIAAQAFESLKALAEESSTEVASEALLSLGRIVRHGGPFAPHAAALLRSAARNSPEPLGQLARDISGGMSDG